MNRTRQFVIAVALGLFLLPGGSIAGAADAPLFDAVRANDVGRVRTLIDEGADVNATEPDGTTPLHWKA